MRALLDANVVIQALLPSFNPQRAINLIIGLALQAKITVLVPRELRREVVAKVASKPALAKHISPQEADRLLALLESTGERLPFLMTSPQRLSRDANDDYLLLQSVVGQAEYLITNDLDLLVLDGTFPYRIVKPGDFLTVLRDRGLI